MLDSIADQLSTLEIDGLAEIWDDREIRAGSSAGWEDQLLPKLRLAGVILVLLSPAYLSSKYCWKEELPRALEMKRNGNALVFLIHLKTVVVPVMLQKFQILPSDRQSVTYVRNRGEVLANIVRQIRKEISESHNKQSAVQVVEKHIPANLPYLCNRTPQEQTL